MYVYVNIVSSFYGSKFLNNFLIPFLYLLSFLFPVWLSCCDNTAWPWKFIESKPLISGFLRFMSTMVGMTAWGQLICCLSSSQIVYLHLQAGDRGRHWKWHGLLKFSNAFPVAHLLQQCHILNLRKQVPPTGHKAFKCISLWRPFSFKPPSLFIFSMETSIGCLYDTWK